MELNLKDRLIIINNVLPQYDTRANMVIKVSIVNKLQLTESENAQVVKKSVGNGEIEIGFTTVEALTNQHQFSLTGDEISYLKRRVDFIDANGMFSEETMDTYDKIFNEPCNESLTE